jgi:hypothetical protein
MVAQTAGLRIHKILKIRACRAVTCQAGPAVYSDGLNKGQVAGIVIGCVLFGLLVGALGMLCWVKRKRLFPQK